MRCKSCDKILNKEELKYKSKNTGEHLDLCKRCLKSVEDDLGYTIIDRSKEEKELNDVLDGLYKRLKTPNV